MSACDICNLRPVSHKNVKFETVTVDLTFTTAIKNVCDECYNRWKIVVTEAARRYDISLKLLDGKISREKTIRAQPMTMIPRYKEIKIILP